MANLKKNFVFSALLTLANYIFPLITYPYVSRVLGVSNIGICNFVDTVVDFCIMFSMMGITVVGVREIATAKGNREELDRTFSSLLSMNAVTSLLAAAALSVAIFLVPKLYAYKEMMFIGVIRLLSNFLCIEWLFKGLEDFRYITLRSILIRTLFVVSVFVFIHKPEDYRVYYLLFSLTFLANAAVNIIYAHRSVSFSLKDLRWRGLAGPFLLIGLYTIMASLYTSFNTIYLGFVSTETQVGYYGTAAKIYGMVIALFTAFTAVMLPRMSAVLAEGREEEFRGIVQKVLRVLFCLGVPVILLMEAEAPDIIRIISGPGYEGAIVPMRILTPLVLVIGIEQVLVLQTMMPKKYDREVLVNSVLGAIVGVSLNILLVRRLASVGSSIVWLSSELVVLAGSVWVVSRRAKIPFPLRELLVEIGKYLVLALLLGLVTRLPGPFYVRFIVACAVTAVYFLALNLLILPNPDVKDLMQSVIPAPCWRILREGKAGLYLFRLMPFSDALSLTWNRMRWAATEDPQRQALLNEKKHERVGRFLESVVGREPGMVELVPKKTFDAAPIWVCWLQGEDQMPALNSICVNSIREHAGVHPVIFLAKEDIASYVTVPTSIEKAFETGRIKPAIYTDYVRCALLACYGGAWLDSTILLTRPLDEDWFRYPFMSVHLDPVDNASVSRYRWATFCLGACPDSVFFRQAARLFEVYFDRKDRNVDYLMIDYFFDLLYRRDGEMKAWVDRIPVSDPDLHGLLEMLNEPYDPTVMESMLARTSLFKLTYKMELQETDADGKPTYWGYLKHRYDR